MFQLPSLRVALGLGDQELEQRLLPAYDAADDLVVVAQCLAADQVVQAAESGQVDAVVVAASLHRLTDVVLAQLEKLGVVLVLLVADPEADRWQARRGVVLSVDSDAATIKQALLAARAGERTSARPRLSSEPVVRKREDRAVAESRPTHRVIAITGGAGSPGRTTVALNVAVALGAAAPTVLVECDLSAPAIAAYLDSDPSRNLCTLAHAVREDPQVWSSALPDELQPLSQHSRFGAVLCGPPKREMRASVGPAFIEQLIAQLALRYEYVVLDVGAELLGMDSVAATHRAVLSAASEVLVVSRSDLVGLWHTRTALKQLERQLGMDRQQIGLVLNRHEARHHHAAAEVAWHLGTTVVSVIPNDVASAEAATAAQRALVVERSSRAARALLQLAERLHDRTAAQPTTLRRELRSSAPSTPTMWWQRFLRRGPAMAPKSPLPLEPEAMRSPIQREAPVAW